MRLSAEKRENIEKLRSNYDSNMDGLHYDSEDGLSLCCQETAFLAMRQAFLDLLEILGE